MPVTVFDFPEVLLPDRTMRLAAAVLWRATPGDPLPVPRGPLAWLRRLRHRLWLRLGPLGIDLHLRWDPPGRFNGEVRRDDGGVVASAGFAWHREPVVYVEHGPGRVRLLGRVYRLPRDGRTLVLLVAPRRRRAPRIGVRRVITPVVPMPPMPPDCFEGDMSPGPGQVSVMTSGDDPVWTAALREDDAVRAFLDA
jgi:hypothetical protein